MTAFSIDISNFHRADVNLPEAVAQDELKIHRTQEFSRFVYIDSVDKWLEEYQKKSERWVKFFEITSKVLTVISVLLSVFIPASLYFLPAWVPWGICLPSIFILSYVRTKLRGKIEGYRHDNVFVPFLKQFLQTHSIKTLHPLGEWDLEAVDKRLKSDEMMQRELQKIHPQCAHNIEDTLQKFDIDNSPFVQQHAACSFAGIKKMQEKWNTVKQESKEAKMHFRMGEMSKFEKARQAALSKGYETLDALDLPAAHPRDQVEKIVLMYYRLVVLFPEIEALLCEGQELYAPFALSNLGSEQAAFADWQLKLAQTLKQDILPHIQPLVALLNQENTKASDFLLALQNVHVRELKYLLYSLIDQETQMKSRLQVWIAQHPMKRLDAIQRRLDELNSKGVLNAAQIKSLEDWIKTHPNSAKKPFIKLAESSSLKEIQNWVAQYPTMRPLSLNDVLKRAVKMREALDRANKSLAALQESLNHATDSNDNCVKFFEELSTFNQNIMLPLETLISREGEESRCKIWAKAFFTKLPAVPFTKETLPEDPGARQRKIEEIRLNAMLKEIDRKMLTTNRTRLWAVKMPLHLLLVAEAICALYFSTPWIFLACAVVTILGEGVSQYIDYRLKRMDKQKQSIKLHHLLMNYPDIGVIPGDRLRLTEVKQLQQKYGLEGVRPTWARTLAEGESILPKCENLESAKKQFAQLAKEGSQRATKYLENRLIMLKSDYFSQDMQKQSRSGKAIRHRIVDIEDTLEGKTPNKGSQLATKYLEERLIMLKKDASSVTSQSAHGIAIKRQIDNIKKTLAKKIPTAEKTQPNKSSHKEEELRNRDKSYKLDRALDMLTEKKLALTRKLADYEEVAKCFERLPAKIASLEAYIPILQVQIRLIDKALENEREPDPRISVTMQEISEILAAIQKDGRREIYTQQLGQKCLFLKKLEEECKPRYNISVIMEEISKILEAIQTDGRREIYTQKLSQKCLLLNAQPHEALLSYRRKIEQTMQQLPRLERMLLRLQKEEDYFSKENVDAKIKEIKAQLEKLNEKYAQLDREYHRCLMRDNNV